MATTKVSLPCLFLPALDQTALAMTLAAVRLGRVGDHAMMGTPRAVALHPGTDTPVMTGQTVPPIHVIQGGLGAGNDPGATVLAENTKSAVLVLRAVGKAIGQVELLEDQNEMTVQPTASAQVAGVGRLQAIVIVDLDRHLRVEQVSGATVRRNETILARNLIGRVRMEHLLQLVRIVAVTGEIVPK
jgi:hypothetical protein